MGWSKYSWSGVVWGVVLSGTLNSAWAQEQASWVLGGYLFSNPETKAYVTIEGRKIRSVAFGEENRPQKGLLLDTDGFVFPGMIDLHGHLKYHVLPLWKGAESQFQNRFEWRDLSQPYKDATTFNIRPIAFGTPEECAAIRWAELKALVGGVTAVQGVGAAPMSVRCATNWGVHNVEFPGEYPIPGGKQHRAYADTDMLVPNYIGLVFIPYIWPIMKAEALDYDQALKRFYAVPFASGWSIEAWIDFYEKKPHTLANGLMLLFGDHFGLDPADPTPGSLEGLKALWPRILERAQALWLPEFRRIVAQNPLKAFRDVNWGQPVPALLDAKAREALALAYLKANVGALLPRAAAWLYGNPASGVSVDDSYLGVVHAEKPKPLRELAWKALMAGIKGKGDRDPGPVVTTVPPIVQEYFFEFETKVRQKAIAYGKEDPRPVWITHMGEGHPEDAFGRQEYRLAHQYGFTKPGFTAIHGLGMSAKDLKHAAQNGVSLVWSPFSNLLLYGDTWDIREPLAAGVTVALGADWTVSGSKNLLDELKFARRYLNLIGAPENVVSNKTLAAMTIINPAKILRVDDVVGRIAEGFQADLLVVSRVSKEGKPFDALLAAQQKDIQLVAVSGQPLYGAPNLIDAAAKAFGDERAPEKLPKRADLCGFEKRLRLPFGNHPDLGGEELLTASSIEARLVRAFDAYAESIGTETERAKLMDGLDPLFNCEDEDYVQFVKGYLPDRLAFDREHRDERRAGNGLPQRYDPGKTVKPVVAPK